MFSYVTWVSMATMLLKDIWLKLKVFSVRFWKTVKSHNNRFCSRILKFQKISIPPPWKGFLLRPPLSPLEIPIKLRTFLSIFWPYRTPKPPGNSNPFCGGSMNISWNCTLLLFFKKLIKGRWLLQAGYPFDYIKTVTLGVTWSHDWCVGIPTLIFALHS